MFYGPWFKKDNFGEISFERVLQNYRLKSGTIRYNKIHLLKLSLSSEIFVELKHKFCFHLKQRKTCRNETKQLSPIFNNSRLNLSNKLVEKGRNWKFTWPCSSWLCKPCTHKINKLWPWPSANYPHSNLFVV